MPTGGYSNGYNIADYIGTYARAFDQPIISIRGEMMMY
jgi:hypothetical protein